MSVNPKQSYELQVAKLRFEPALEREFLDNYFTRSVIVARITLITAVVVYLIFIIADTKLRMRAQFDQNAVRMLCIGFLGVMMGISFSRLMPRFYEVLVLSTFLINGLCATIIGSYSPDPAGTTLTFVIMVIFIGYTLSRMRTWVSAVACLTITANYIIAALTYLPGLRLTLSDAFLSLFTSNLFGIMASYTLERSVRSDFILKRQLDVARAQADMLLKNMLPEAVAERLKVSPGVLAEKHDQVTVLFADIVDFTPLSAKLSPEEVVSLLNQVFSLFDRLAKKHGIEKIKTVGDAYMAVSGLPKPRADHGAAAMRLAIDIRKAALEFEPALRLRIGLNSGPVVAGVISVDKYSYDLWGDTVNVASRMESQGVSNEIQVTEAVYELLKDRYSFEKRGEIEVKGKGRMPVYMWHASSQVTVIEPDAIEAPA